MECFNLYLLSHTKLQVCCMSSSTHPDCKEQNQNKVSTLPRHFVDLLGAESIQLYVALPTCVHPLI